MTFSIGEQLKQARLKRGLTLVQASQSTHIRINYLEALENDQRDALPSNVQGRGFLRLYAGLLNLPIDPLLAAWDGKPYIIEEPAPAVGAPTEPTPEEKSPAGQASHDTAEEQPAKKRRAPKLPSIKFPVKKQATEELSGANQTSVQYNQEPATVAPEPEPALPPIKDPAIVKEDPPVAVPPPLPEAVEPEPTGSRLIFNEVGEKLKQQREALGLSLVEVERYTRLRIHYIQALEAGRMDDLPSPVQGRGMLSNYAEFLNMDEDALLLRFAEGLQARRVERLPKPEPQVLVGGKKQRRPAQQAPLWRRFLTPDLLFGFGMAAIILFFILWSSARYFAGNSQPPKPTPPGIAEILLTQMYTGTPGALMTGTPPVAPNAGGATNIAGEQATLPAEGTTVTDGTPSAEGTPLAETSGTPIVIQNGTPTPPTPPDSKDPLQIYIVAKQRAFLRVTADDKVKFLGRVVPGNAYTFSGAKRIELLTGSAAAIQVFYNKQDLGVLGNSGQVANLIFVPAGIWTPTAAFTATQPPAKPTATPTVKPTLMATPSITPFVP